MWYLQVNEVVGEFINVMAATDLFSGIEKQTALWCWEGKIILPFLCPTRIPSPLINKSLTSKGSLWKLSSGPRKITRAAQGYTRVQ